MSHPAGYKLLEVFYPYLSDFSNHELQQAIEKFSLLDDDTGEFDRASASREFVLVYKSSCHERDSSGDGYLLYQKTGE